MSRGEWAPRWALHGRPARAAHAAVGGCLPAPDLPQAPALCLEALPSRGPQPASSGHPRRGPAPRSPSAGRPRQEVTCPGRAVRGRSGTDTRRHQAACSESGHLRAGAHLRPRTLRPAGPPGGGVAGKAPSARGRDPLPRDAGCCLDQSRCSPSQRRGVLPITRHWGQAPINAAVGRSLCVSQPMMPLNSASPLCLLQSVAVRG